MDPLLDISLGGEVEIVMLAVGIRMIIRILTYREGKRRFMRLDAF